MQMTTCEKEKKITSYCFVRESFPKSYPTVQENINKTVNVLAELKKCYLDCQNDDETL